MVAVWAHVASAGNSDQNATKVSSPAGTVVLNVKTPKDGQVSFDVLFNGAKVFADSTLGISLDKVVYGSNAKLVKVERSSFDDKYATRPVHATARNHYNEIRLYLENAKNKNAFQIWFRAFDDGFAYRFVVPGGEKARDINGEPSILRLAQPCSIWANRYNNSYESDFSKYGSETVKGLFCPPVTGVFPDGHGYFSVTEANLVHYSGSGITLSPHGGIQFSISHSWKQKGAVTTPWRAVVLAKNLTVLVNTDIVTNLCPPPSPELAKAKWIKTGRSLWSWLYSGTLPPDGQKHYADVAGELGFEYNLVDWRWDRWKDAWATLKDLVEYSKKRGVGVWVWRHSRSLRDKDKRLDFFKKAKEAGVAGLKIDFFPPETAETIDFYEAILKETAELHLMVNFHGANKPTGRARTWPHEMSREGIKGHEWHMKGRYKLKTVTEAVEPFTRLIAGHGDFTPTVFAPKRLHGRSWSHELSQAIIFAAGVINYSTNADFALKNPAVDVLKTIPSTWDETIVLPGTVIGDTAGFARRSGDTWFVGILNTDKPKNFKFDLGFLKKNVAYDAVLLFDDKDNPATFDRKERKVSSGDSLSGEMRGQGGFVARFTPVGKKP
jgi:alpha-glucosidase